MKAHHARFSEAIWYSDKMPEVTIGGVGGIGSWLTLLLARIGVYMYIHDMDNVDETNMAGQAYFTTDIGRTKQDSVIGVARGFCGRVDIDPMGEFTENSFCSNIAFSAFDSMKARRLMFERWKANPDKELFIDGRMLMEQGCILVVTPDRIEAYEATLFEDSAIADVPCSAKATSHSGTLIASLMVGCFTNYLANKKIGFEARELPFKLEYNLHLMMLDNA